MGDPLNLDAPRTPRSKITTHAPFGVTINILAEVPLIRSGSLVAGDVRFGLDWRVEPAASGDRICHSGSNGTGFRSYVEFDAAKGHGLVIMTNSSGGAKLCQELIGRIGVP